MAVLPGSLDYLYYNHILDTPPFEAYEPMPVANGKYKSEFDNLFNTVDTFTKERSQQQVYDQPDKIEGIVDVDKERDHKRRIRKGCVAIGALASIPIYLLLKHKCNFSKMKNNKYVQKLNPKTWFK